MTTKEKLIETLNTWDSQTQCYPFHVLCDNAREEIAELIISKLPEWGWSYNEPDHPIHQEPTQQVDLTFSGKLPEGLKYLDCMASSLIEITPEQKQELTVILEKHGDLKKLHADWCKKYL